MGVMEELQAAEATLQGMVQKATTLASNLRTEFAGHSIVEDLHIVLADLTHLVRAPAPGEPAPVLPPGQAAPETVLPTALPQPAAEAPQEPTEPSA